MNARGLPSSTRCLLGPAGCRRDFSLDSLGRGRRSGVGRAQRMAAQRPALAHRWAAARELTGNHSPFQMRSSSAVPGALKTRV
jgi:hypothetical protein